MKRSAAFFFSLTFLNTAAAEAASLGSFAHWGQEYMFEELTNKETRLWEVFHGASSWETLEKPWFVEDWAISRLSKWQDQSEDHFIVFSMMPFFRSGPMLEDCARGNYDEHYGALAQNLADAGLGSMIIRVGWEWSGDWFAWGVGNDPDRARVFADCYRHVVESMRDRVPGNRWIFDWNPNNDVSREVLEHGWPGADFVDVVGVDLYDKVENCNEGDLECRWTYTLQDFNKIRDFSRSVEKPLSIPEWGLWDDDPRNFWGAGDNPVYVARMCHLINDPANMVIYHVYFETSKCEANYSLADHPGAREAFKKHCSGSSGNIRAAIEDPAR